MNGHDNIPDQSPFQQRAEVAVLGVLSKHNEDIDFQSATDSDGRPWIVGSFDLHGQQHEIEIYTASIVMTCGKQLFEPYMPREFASEEAQIRGFVERLDRYLSGGSWEGADEYGAIMSLIVRLRDSVCRWVRRR